MNIQVRHDKETGMYVGTDLNTGITARADAPYDARVATEAAVTVVTEVEKANKEFHDYRRPWPKCPKCGENRVFAFSPELPEVDPKWMPCECQARARAEEISSNG